MNYPDFYMIIDKLPDEDIRSAAVMMKAAWCHFEQQRLFAKFKRQYPPLTSVVIVNYKAFPDYKVVVTFSDGVRKETRYNPDVLGEDAESIVLSLIAEHENL